MLFKKKWGRKTTKRNFLFTQKAKKKQKLRIQTNFWEKSTGCYTFSFSFHCH